MFAQRLERKAEGAAVVPGKITHVLILLIMNRNAHSHRVASGVGYAFGPTCSSPGAVLHALSSALAAQLVLAQFSEPISAVSYDFGYKACNADSWPGVQPDRPRVGP